LPVDEELEYWSVGAVGSASLAAGRTVTEESRTVIEGYRRLKKDAMLEKESSLHHSTTPTFGHSIQSNTPRLQFLPLPELLPHQGIPL
jgi:hypothetical protein